MTQLIVSVPYERLTPLRWVAEFVFHQVLGVPAEVRGTEEKRSTISTDDASLAMPSLFPKMRNGVVDRAVPLPALPLAGWTPASGQSGSTPLEEPLPVLLGSPRTADGARHIDCGVDILGTIFFMLSRYEEVLPGERDVHGRFPAHRSLARHAGFLLRPIVDEYISALWSMMLRLWPGLKRRQHEGRVAVSCDVDFPFDVAVGSVPALLRAAGSDLLRQRAFVRAGQRLRNFAAHRRNDYRFDPNHTFDRYLDICERYGRRAAFYFIADHSAGAIDGNYQIKAPRILALIKTLDARGHEIGMHGSYNTFRDRAQIARERSRLKEACMLAGADATVSGNRQHYLRWDTAETPDHLDEAGFDYDTTGSFADSPGFRFGTSHSFPMWSWRRDAPLKIVQRPLIVMEASVISEKYLGLGYSEAALSLMLTLKERSLAYGGTFGLLWHNSHFLRSTDWDFFEQLVR